MKYVDSEKLIAEIERLKEETPIGICEYDKGEENGRYEVLNHLLSTITSLQQEQDHFAEASKMGPEVDLEKAFAHEYAIYHLPNFVLASIVNGTELIDFIYETAHYFWNKGYNAREK